VLGVLRLYGETAALAARRALRAWPVAFSLVLYALVLALLTPLVGPLGMAGGIIVMLVLAACLSSYLHLISHVVAGIRLRWSDLRQSAGARFWDVISVLFAFWVLDLAIRYVLAPAAGPKAPIVIALVGLATAVFFNPVPELLYQGTSRSFLLLADAVRFVSRHGLEWLIPNLLFAAALLAPLGKLHGPAGQVVLDMAQLLAPNNQGMALLALFWQAPPWLQLPMLVFVHFVMVFRGILFKELTSGGSRQRALRDVWRR
jgi:hypothetical protein